MSAITIMAAALDKELQHRGIFNGRRHVSRDECAEILRTVIDSAAAVAQAYETSHPGPKPPSGRATDGGCITPSDVSAVDLQCQQSWTAFLDGAGEP